MKRSWAWTAAMALLVMAVLTVGIVGGLAEERTYRSAFSSSAAEPIEINAKISMPFKNSEKPYSGKDWYGDISFSATDSNGDDASDKVTLVVRKGSESGSTVSSFKDVGTYYFSLELKSGYEDTYKLSFSAPQPRTITPADVTVTPAKKQTKVFGQAEPELEYVVSNDDLASEVDGKMGREPGENVGTYNYTIGTLHGSDNINMTFDDKAAAGRCFTIKKLPVTVKAKSVTKYYGAKEPVIEYTVEYDTSKCALDEQAVRNEIKGKLTHHTATIGEYRILNQLKPSDNVSLDFSADGAKYTVLPLPVTVKVTEGQSKVYGSKDSKFDFEVVYDTNATELTEDQVRNQISGNLGRVKGEDVGSYEYNQGTMKSKNGYIDIEYVLSESGAKYEIEPLSVTVKVKEGQSKVYGSNDSAFGFEVIYDTSTTDLNETKVRGMIDGELGRAPGEDVGTYAYNLGTMKPKSGNITIKDDVLANDEYEIKKLSVKVIARSADKIFWEEDPEFKYDINPSNTELMDEENLRKQIGGKLTRAEGEDAREYEFVGDGCLTSDNLDLDFSELNKEGHFTINTRSVTIVIPDEQQTKKFGAKDPEFTFTLTDDPDPEAKKVAYSSDDLKKELTGDDLTREEGEIPGDYEFVVSKIISKNLKINFDSETVKFTIEAEPCFTVTVENEEEIDTRTKAVTVTVAGIEIDKLPDVTIKIGENSTPLDKGNYFYTIDIAENDGSPATWLPEGTNEVILNYENAPGTAAAEFNVKKAVRNIEILNNNDDQDYVLDGTLDIKVTDEKDAVADADENEEIVLVVNGGAPVKTDTKNCKAKLDEEIRKVIDNATEHQTAVSVSVQITSSDVVGGSDSKKYTYDREFNKLAEDDVKNFKNRKGEVSFIAPDDIYLLGVDVTGGSATPDTETRYKKGETVTISYTYPTESLPPHSDMTITYKHAADGVEDKVTVGSSTGSAGSIYVTGVKPGAKSETENDLYLVKEIMDSITVQGRGTPYETVVVTVKKMDGTKIASVSALITGTSGEYSTDKKENWSVNLPIDVDTIANEPLQLVVNYATASGSTKARFIYDNESVYRLVSPVYSGMKFLAGFAEVGSDVVIVYTDAEGNEVEQSAETDAFGYFSFILDEGIESDFTLYATDIAQNEKYDDYAMPLYDDDVEWTGKVYPLGALIMDDQMVRFAATPVDLSTLAGAPVDLPLLLGNYFKVGNMHIELVDGKVTFLTEMNDGFEAGNVYFKVFNTQPAEDALDNRAASDDINAGYAVGAEDSVLWIIYEADTDFTPEQLKLEENAFDTLNDEDQAKVSAFGELVEFN